VQTAKAVPAAGEAAAAGEPVPACDRVLHGSLSLTSSKHILRGHVTDRAIKAHGVVVIHVALNQAPGILQGQRCQWPDTLAFKRFVPAFEFSLGVSCQLRHNVTLKDDDSVLLILIIPGTDANLNC
jgi:hypothetical protein